LQGESLLNDATALLIYRAAVAAAVGSFSLVGDAPILLLAAVGSLVAGYVLGATVYGRNPICTGCGRQHRPAIHQHLRGVASVGAFDAVADHHSRGLRHDAGASCLRTVGPTPAHHLLCSMGDRGVRRQCAGVCADGIASPSHHRALVAGAALGLASLRAHRARTCDCGSHCLARGVPSDRRPHQALASQPRGPAGFAGSTRRNCHILERDARPRYAGNRIRAARTVPRARRSCYARSAWCSARW
jgi:hypothetical protein